MRLSLLCRQDSKNHTIVKRSVLRTLGISVLVVALGACGGGGGVSVPSIPTPQTPPTPPPPPPPAGDPEFNTAEYQNSRAAVVANAISAYEEGATGKGVTAAIVDDSFAASTAPFADRIHPASQDVVADRGLDGLHHHGTAVASILGASKNDAGMHGVAFDATLLLLRTDTPGTCTATSATCQFNQTDIAKAFDIAVENGARVINLSMAFPINPTFTDAIDRATEAGVVVVIAAANQGASEPFSSALVAAKPEAHDSVIIAGALNTAGTDLASFSNRAGSGASFYLSAVGEGLSTYDRYGKLVCCGEGTSLSAPAIAGAVAILAQAFPNLTGKQIVELLLTTATDMGASGTDVIYGRGKLNLANAFAPQGSMSLADSSAPISLVNNGVLSSAMGDAAGKLGGVIFLDSYARAYQVDLSHTLSRASLDAPLSAALDGTYRTNSAGLGPLAVSITTRQDFGGSPETRIQRLELAQGQAQTAKAVAGMAVGRLSSKTALAFGFSESGRTLQQRLAQRGGDAFLVARDPLVDNGFHGAAGASIGIRHDFGPLSVTMTSEGGQVRDFYTTQATRSGYRSTFLGAERTFGRLNVGLGGSLLNEQRTIFGGRFAGPFSIAGSKSWFADADASLDFGAGWSAEATYRQGWTSIRGSDSLVKSGRLSSNAFTFGLAKGDAFRTGDRMALRIMQPLRAHSGGLKMFVPVSYDYSSGEAGYQYRLFDLAPNGRELVYEISYGARVLGGNITANAFVRTNAGHVEAMTDDVGGAIRLSAGF